MGYLKPNAAKTGDTSKVPRAKAVVCYRDPLAIPDLVASGFPEGGFPEGGCPEGGKDGKNAPAGNALVVDFNQYSLHLTNSMS